MKRSLIAALLILAAAPASADPEVDALRAQIKALESRLDALERQKTAAQTPPASAAQAVPAGVSAPQAPAQAYVLNPTSGGTREQQVSAAPPQMQASVAYVPGGGVTFSTPDKNFMLRISGYAQADARTFVDNLNATNQDQFFIRSARPIIEARFFDKFSARLMWDFGNNQTQLLDAYADYNAAKWFNLRVGKFKDPIGLERWQSEKTVLFVERGMTTNLVPFRDNGIQVYGSPLPGSLEYQVAVTNGSPDLVNATNGTDSDKTVTARIMAHPFYESGIDALKGLGVGFAATIGNHDGSATNTEVTSGYVTPGQFKFFTYSAATFASGGNQRYNPQLMYYWGPFGMFGEYVIEDEDVKAGAAAQSLRNKAWMATASYVLTGEDARFDGVVPRENFDPAAGHWGAFEIVGRVSALQVDDDAFPTFASIATSAKSARESSIGGTWYLNPNLKLNLDFALTRFEGGAGTGDLPTERAILSRAQFSF